MKYWEIFLFFVLWLRTVVTESRWPNGIGLNCLDNDEKEVAWWVLYKPPSTVTSKTDGGRAFAYVTSATTAATWQFSTKQINENNMLLHTVAPLYQARFYEDMATAVIDFTDDSTKKVESTFQGVLMADIAGGVILTHTIPGFPDTYQEGPVMPTKEMRHGQLAICMKVSLLDFDSSVLAISRSNPSVVQMRVPGKFQTLIPNFAKLAVTNSTRQKAIEEYPMTIKSAILRLLVKPPGNDECPFLHIAKSMNIFLDLYSPTFAPNLTNACSTRYGVRYIDSIKFVSDHVTANVNYRPDRSRFAIGVKPEVASTKGGQQVHQVVCFTSMDKELQKNQGAVLLCMWDSKLWNFFNMLKQGQPTCTKLI